MVPWSKLSASVCRLLVTLGYLSSAQVVEEKAERRAASKRLALTLTYTAAGRPALTGIKRVSKPGRRSYTASRTLPRVLSGYGSAVVSTSLGVMTEKDARNKRVGGEILFYVW